jgi:hypothetical protein
MNLSPLSLIQCQFCKNRDGGLFLCPNCGREYPYTTLPGVLVNAGSAIAVFALACIRIWWSCVLNSRSAFAGFRARLQRKNRNLAVAQPREESLPRVK